MDFITCPTCRSNVIVVDCESVDCREPHGYKPLPQPDLTKLRELYEKYEGSIEKIKKEYSSIKENWDELNEEVEKNIGKLILAIKEVI